MGLIHEAWNKLIVKSLFFCVQFSESRTDFCHNISHIHILCVCVCKANLHTIWLQFMHLLSFCFMNKALFSVRMNECLCVREELDEFMVFSCHLVFYFHFFTTLQLPLFVTAISGCWKGNFLNCIKTAFIIVIILLLSLLYIVYSKLR